MGRTLAKTVTLMDDNGNFQTYLKGTEPTEDVAERITNPAAWAPDLEEDPERDPERSWPPDGGLAAMTDSEIFRAANSNSTSSGDEGEQGDLRTVKGTGSFDPNPTYQGLTIPTLKQMALDRELNVEGLRRRDEFVKLLTEDDARNE